MNYLSTITSKIKFKEQHVPLIFLILAIFGFGLLANRLGYYQDDWPYVFYAFNKGIPSLTEGMYYDSRPFGAWLYISLFNILGFKPISWHIVAIIFRWLTATFLWYFLKRIWPNNKSETTFTALLFIVHPFFLIQPYAVNSMLYWSGFLLLAFSLWLMTYYVQEKKYVIPLAIAAALLEGLHLFTVEYFVGIVLLRPLLLYWILDTKELTPYERIRRAFLYWLPFLAALSAYVTWRLFFFTPPPLGDRNAPWLIYKLLESPIPTLIQFSKTALQDSLIVTITSWYNTLTPELLSFPSIFSWFVFIISGLTLFGLIYSLFNILKADPNEEERWFAKPLILGFLWVVLGLVPIWLIGQDIVTHKNQYAGSRFGIGATFGASLIVAVIIKNLIDDTKKRIAATSLLVALAVGMHLANEKNFAYGYEKQQAFVQQLTWRAPAIKPGTAIVTDEEILGFMGSYSVSFAITTAYQPGNVSTPPYWYFPFYYTNPDVGAYLSGYELSGSRLGMFFSGTSKQMILVLFTPEAGRCLWVMQPQDENLRLINDDMRGLSTGSNMELINQDDKAAGPPQDIFGKPNDEHWCYFFEKADLARQYQEWDQIVKLWNEAGKAGERADNGFEYIPFIEGFGHTGDWEQVKSLTKLADRVTSGLRPSLCSAMDRLSESAPPSPGKDETIHSLQENLKCDD